MTRSRIVVKKRALYFIYLLNMLLAIPVLFAGYEKNENDSVCSAIRQHLDKGAFVDARDEYGNTALIQAVRFCHLGAVSLLLANGANPDLKNEIGVSAKMIASANIAVLRNARKQVLIFNLLQKRVGSNSSNIKVDSGFPDNMLSSF